jgi:hypothetical protein
MKFRLIITTAFVFLAAAGIAENTTQGSAHESPHYTRTEIKQLRRDAHTVPQYQVLSDYFRQQRQTFQEQAEAEKREWDRRNQNIVGSAAKYPRPVDSARNLYEYYSYEASKSAVLAAQYQQLAQNGQVAANR